LQQDCRSAHSSGWKDRLGRISVAIGQQHHAMRGERLPDMRKPGEVCVFSASPFKVCMTNGNMFLNDMVVRWSFIISC
jgi:hypothetical protein